MDKLFALALTLSLAACGGAGAPDCPLSKYEGPALTAAEYDYPTCLRATADYWDCAGWRDDAPPVRCCADEYWERGRLCSGPQD